MLPKKLFLSTLKKIQKQEARIDEFNAALSKICDGFPVFDSENQYLIALRELLKYTMQDQYDYIDWWLYEAPDTGYTIWWDDVDGKEIRMDLTEPGALYDYSQKPRTTTLQKGRRTMKTISSAIFYYMSEWQAIFQYEEYSFSEACPYQDKQKNLIGMSSC